jgi:SAM-dependent methyltransferase
MWMAGDFGQIARHIETGAEEFIARLELKPGERLLDVACGSGNLALPAARAGAIVTGVDIATNLLEQARARAASEGLKIQFDEGDAESLPYGDAAFDTVVSMFGAMFAPRPELVAAELARVCRPGGRIAMANWTPEGFVGQMFKTTGKHVPPPPTMPSPLKWGDEEAVRERLRDGIADLKLTRQTCKFDYPFPPAEVVETFRLYYGPTQRAFEALDTDAQAALRNDLERLWADHNQATAGTTRVEGEYLEVVATRS